MKSGKNGTKLGHNDGTPSRQTPIPKHPTILNRDGRYYYRRRIPSDLVRLECYGKAKDIKRSLKTNDLATAKRLAITVAVEVDEEFEAKRRDVKQGTSPQSATKGDTPAKRRLAGLSEMERRDFIIRTFITSERQEGGRRAFSRDSEIRERRLETAREDLAALEGSPLYQEIDWLAKTREALEAEGVTIEGENDPLLHELSERLRRASIETAWRTERTMSGNQFAGRDPLFKALHADSATPSPAKDGKTVGDLCGDYLAHNQDKVEKRNLARSTIPKIKMRCRILMDFFGEKKLLASITKEDAANLVDFLPTIPQNAAKRYKGVSVVLAAEREAKLQTKRLIHAETAEDYLTGLSALLTHAVDEEWMSGNPLKRRLVRERLAKPKKRSRQTLTPDEMALLFSTAEFSSLRQSTDGLMNARFWLPLLCLFHGTRANEIAGLRAADVQGENEIPFLDLCETDEHRLKTDSSKRKVPLHKQLISLGFLEFAETRRRDDPQGYLFAGLKRNKNGSRADSVCKWWQRLVTSNLGAAANDGPNGARGIHSFRHSWAMAARAAGLDESIRKRLGGWAQTDTAGDYGWSNELPLLKQEIDKIEFPSVDFFAISQSTDG
ncbi:MAG: site-specific integrase [Prosthecobacter sp.]|uniref:site-specific integrase n=1 Tax=Prosthecobacter sp. TaxID=1965333 RepID=UPI0025DC33B2|nr:site-specific integrase [Prosthecobacter sp.]MCF7786384.1 site-specific integrase [Prosthecobacter sp.]